jgi:hypothetical protein
MSRTTPTRIGRATTVDYCPYDDMENDADVDQFCGNVDSCAADFHNDLDSDLLCGDVDSCSTDKENDNDSDKVCGNFDSCPVGHGERQGQ